MSRCSKKCNELKQKIDEISGLNDDFVFEKLYEIEKLIDLIDSYADEDELNGTCFSNNQTDEKELDYSVKEIRRACLAGRDDQVRHDTEDVEQNYISKYKIKEKLEELKDKEKEMTCGQGYWGGSDLQAKIEILEELLGV